MSVVSPMVLMDQWLTSTSLLNPWKASDLQRLDFLHLTFY